MYHVTCEDNRPFWERLCRKIEKALKRDIHFIWLAGYEKPDHKTINNFRNRVKDEIGKIFTQLVLLLAERGFVTLDVEYIDGTKIESKANKYTFVWRKSVEKNRAKLLEKTKVLLQQVDDAIAQDKAAENEPAGFTPQSLASLIDGLKDALAKEDAPHDKEQKRQHCEKKRRIKLPPSSVRGCRRLRLRIRRKLPLHGRGRNGSLRKIQPLPPRTAPTLQTHPVPP